MPRNNAFEIVARDASGKIGAWNIGKHRITTPTIAVVVNPHNQVIPARELRKYGAEIIITNAYIIKKSENREIIEKGGIRRFYGWDGPIYTDSGTFQMYSQGAADISPEETLRFQQKIGSDIITPLDIFTLPTDSKKIAQQKLADTIKRIKYGRRFVKERALCGPIQGGLYPDLRKKAAIEVSKFNPDLFAIGGIVPLMEQYRFGELADMVLSAREGLDPSKPVHAFGCGHPMLFSLMAAIGVDVFDSAAYALFAKQGRYLTSRGTEYVSELHELPCSCPICCSNTVRELQADTKLIAEHNLYATFEEIRTIKQAIYDGGLWGLVEQRIRAHPALLDGYLALKQHKQILEKNEPISGRHAFFYTGAESKSRPMVLRAKERAQKLIPSKLGKLFNRRLKMRSKNTFDWLGAKIPIALKSAYPFGQSVLPNCKKARKTASEPPISAAKYIIAYQYGAGIGAVGRAINNKCDFELSKNTGRLIRISKNGSILGTFRDYDGYFVPTLSGANRIMKAIGKKLWVEVRPDAVRFVRDGMSLFAKFVADADANIRLYDEVFVLDRRGKLIATGTVLMTRDEMFSFKYGVAVKIRHGDALA